MLATSVPPPFLTRYRYPLVTGLHVLLLAVLVSALYAFGLIRFLPSDDNLLQWDVMWYEQIRSGGYSYSATTTSNAAFFPMLPYVWRYTGLGPLGMSLFNAGLFLASFTALAAQLRLPARLQLLLLSTPSLLFMAVPYTEALFFCFAALLLLGLQRQQLALWLLGLLGCGLTRSASVIFTPALLFMVLIWAGQPGQLRRALAWGATGLLALAASVGIVAATLGHQTGEPWAFILAQKHWNRTVGIPDLPFTDPSGVDMLWFDSLGIWLGVAAIGLCGWLAWRWLRGLRGQLLPAIGPEVVFSLAYCVGVVIIVVMTQHGSIWNLGRYMLATPFFVVIVGYASRQPHWPVRRYLLIAVATMLLWQVFGIYTLEFDNFSTPQALWYFGLVTAYAMAYLGWRQLRWQGEITMLLYLFNLIMLLHLLEGWLQGYIVQ